MERIIPTDVDQEAVERLREAYFESTGFRVPGDQLEFREDMRLTKRLNGQSIGDDLIFIQGLKDSIGGLVLRVDNCEDVEYRGARIANVRLGDRDDHPFRSRGYGLLTYFNVMEYCRKENLVLHSSRLLYPKGMQLWRRLESVGWANEELTYDNNGSSHTNGMFVLTDTVDLILSSDN